MKENTLNGLLFRVIKVIQCDQPSSILGNPEICNRLPLIHLTEKLNLFAEQQNLMVNITAVPIFYNINHSRMPWIQKNIKFLI